MISDKFGIQPELLYVMKGAKVDGTIFDEEATEDVTLKADYLSIPIMAKYYFGGLNLQAGLTFDFLMSAKSVYDD
ncbi:MAG: PorT family protein, partial [Bacteroidales bacterium]|nr:PorT family protein [Bacteroidales bacterium]